MAAIARAHGPAGVSDADRLTIAAAGRIVLGLGDVHERVAARSPAELAAVLPHDEAAAQAVRMLSVMSLVDGRIDPRKIALVGEYADALDADEDDLRVLAEAAEGEIAAAAACMVRKNIESFPRLDRSRIDEDAVAAFLPYRDGHDDPALAARYAALGELAPGTFGRAFHEHFTRNGFAFPGDPDGLAEGFTTPHDTSHVLSGYSTTPPGEVCVSTFISGMHPDHPLAAEVLPVLFSWHLGIELIELAGSTTGSYEPERFWTAWERGAETTVDVVAGGWDFWGAVGEDLEELRRAYSVAPLDPGLSA
jgi:hypothetical protein